MPLMATVTIKCRQMLSNYWETVKLLCWVDY